MPPMRNILTGLILTLVAAAFACARPPQAAASPSAASAAAAVDTPAADAGVTDVLEALKARGQNLQDFTADVVMTDTDAITAAESKNFGNVKFQRQPDGNTRIRVSFDHRKIG